MCVQPEENYIWTVNEKPIYNLHADIKNKV